MVIKIHVSIHTGNIKILSNGLSLHVANYAFVIHAGLGQHGEIRTGLSVSIYELFMIDVLGWSKVIHKQLTVVTHGLMVMVIL